MRGRIFISYRRDDSAATCGRLYDRLVSRFGRGSVFKDVDSIGYGSKFREDIENALNQCTVELVVIGPKWLSLANALGQPRIEEINDTVRFEVESALNRGMVTIPVLVQGAATLDASQLPKGLEQLADLQALNIRYDPDFDADARRLISAIEQIFKAKSTLPRPKAKSTAQSVTNVITKSATKVASLVATTASFLTRALGYGISLGILEGLLGIAAVYDWINGNLDRGKLLICLMAVLAIIFFFMIGVSRASRTGVRSTGLRTAVLAAIIAAPIGGYITGWTVAVETTTQFPDLDTMTDLLGTDAMLWIAVFIITGIFLSLIASSLGVGIGIRRSLTSPTLATQRNTIVHTGFFFGGSVALFELTLALTLYQNVFYVVMGAAAMLLASYITTRRVGNRISGVVASALVGAIVGIGAGVSSAWGYPDQLAIASDHNIVTHVGAYVVGWLIIMLALSLPIGTIGCVLGYSTPSK